MKSEEFNKTLCEDMKKLNEALHQLCIDLVPKFIRKWVDKYDIK